jgi:cytochrome c-type biogenesis protein CcmH/NrfF
VGRREEDRVDAGTWLVLWGSPAFFAGLGVLLWGVGHLKRSEVARSGFELKERQHQYQYERTQAKEGGAPATR